MSLQPRVELVSSSPPIPHQECIAAVEEVMDGLLDALGEGLAVSMCREHLASGGKRLRASLALHAMQALGRRPEGAVAWAAACELLHNASLVHDDLQDGDRYRRGVEALWSRYGMEQAVNAGDLLLMLPTLAVGRLSCAPATKWALAELLARHSVTTAVGQAEELGLRERQDVSLASYLKAAQGKTAGLFGLPVEGSALLAGLAPPFAHQVAQPFRELGLIYQLVDDVVDLYGDKGRDVRGGDIREGKVSVLVAMHLASHPEDQAWVLSILAAAREQTRPEQVEDLTERFRASGTLAAVLEEIDERCARLDRQPGGGDTELRGVADALRARIVAPLEVMRG